MESEMLILATKIAGEQWQRFRAALKSADLPADDIDLPGRTFFEFTRDGRSVGWGGFETHGTDGLLRSMVVEPAYRSKGVAVQKDEPFEVTIKRATAQLDEFRNEGGEELLQSQFAGKTLVKRSRGKPGNARAADAVKELKASGLSQAEAAVRLGLAKSTVHRYWHS